MDWKRVLSWQIEEDPEFKKEVSPDGTINYYDSAGNLHRRQGPAVIYPDGTLAWYDHGKLHRDEGPAVIKPNGAQVWYNHGKVHREDGPAIIYNNSRPGMYWFNGEPFDNMSDYLARLEELKNLHY